MLKRTLACLAVTAITMAACSALVAEPQPDPDACHVDLPIGHPKQGTSC